MTHPDPHAPAPSADPSDPTACPAPESDRASPFDPADGPPPGGAYGWDRARADYLAGEPANIVAVRLGVAERTLHRHAAREGWRRADSRAAARVLGVDPRFENEGLEPDSPLALFVSASEYETGELLMKPSPERYLRFAFRRSAEAATRGRPAEALAWARLARVIERLGPGVEESSLAFNAADYIRAAFATKLDAAFEPDDDDEDEDAGA